MRSARKRCTGGPGRQYREAEVQAKMHFEYILGRGGPFEDVQRDSFLIFLRFR